VHHYAKRISEFLSREFRDRKSKRNLPLQAAGDFSDPRWIDSRFLVDSNR
jgi:hypothetical protein